MVFHILPQLAGRQMEAKSDEIEFEYKVPALSF